MTKLLYFLNIKRFHDIILLLRNLRDICVIWQDYFNIAWIAFITLVFLQYFPHVMNCLNWKNKIFMQFRFYTKLEIMYFTSLHVFFIFTAKILFSSIEKLNFLYDSVICSFINFLSSLLTHCANQFASFKQTKLSIPMSRVEVSGYSLAPIILFARKV